MKLQDLTAEMIAEAVRLYMAEAYAGASPPAAVEARLGLAAGGTFADLAGRRLLERSPAGVPLERCERLRLRLGSRRHPHMKLGLDRVPDTDEWVLAVDTHDGMILEAAGDKEQAAVRDLISDNADTKMRIERRWAEAGLPTFERFIRERLKKKK